MANCYILYICSPWSLQISSAILNNYVILMIFLELRVRTDNVGFERLFLGHTQKSNILSVATIFLPTLSLILFLHHFPLVDM